MTLTFHDEFAGAGGSTQDRPHGDYVRYKAGRRCDYRRREAC